MGMHEFDSDAFIVRNPILSYNFVREGVFKFGYQNDWVRGQFENSLIKEGLLIGSREVYEYFSKEHGITADEQNLNHQKFHKTLINYLIRMGSKCVPFGLFATISVGKWSNQTSIDLGPSNDIRRVVRIDNEYYAELARTLINDIPDPENITYFPNNTIYSLKDKIRFLHPIVKVQPNKYTINKKIHNLVTISKDDIIIRVLDWSQGGKSIAFLSDRLTNIGYEIRESTAYLNSLINAGVLISEFEPTLSGSLDLNTLVHRLSELRYPKIATLIEVRESINQINSGKSNFSLSDHTKLRQKFNILCPNSGLKSNVLQVDAFRSNTSAVVDKRVIGNIPKAIRLATLSHGDFKKQSILEQFKRAFAERYETTVVQLVEALSPEHGIGYGDQLHLSTYDTYQKHSAPIDDERLLSLKLSILEKSIKENLRSIDLSEDHNDILNLAPVNLPDYFCLSGTIHRYPNEEDFLRLKMISNSITRIVGRFSHIPEIKKLLGDTVLKEDLYYTKSIRAEVVHIPSDRIGNVIIREKLSEYEIPIITRSNNSEQKQISISDLYLFLRENELILWSKHLNQRVYPKLSSAHNYHYGSLPIYHFLADLQFQDFNIRCTWNWGSLSKMKILPRVKYKNIILSPRTWNLTLSELLPNRESGNVHSEICSKLVELGIPESFTINSGENDTLINRNVNDLVSLLVKDLKKNGTIKICENLLDQDEFVAKSTNGEPFATEIVFNLTKNHFRPKRQNFNPEQIKAILNPSVAVKKSFLPGSDWIYYKVYLSRSISDRLIVDFYDKIIAPSLKEDLVDCWFFIRYMDPKFHLRIRMHLKEETSNYIVTKKIEAFFYSYFDQGLISEFNHSTYVRELDRYGSVNIALFEKLFETSSTLVVKLLCEIQRDISIDRHIVCVIGTDVTLRSFGISIEKRIDIFRTLGESMRSNLSPFYQEIIDRYYQENYSNQSSKIINLLLELANRAFCDHQYATTLTLLVDYLTAVEDMTAKIVGNSATEKQSVEELAKIVSHLFINRITDSGTFTWEPLTNIYLSKILNSIKKRNLFDIQ